MSMVDTMRTAASLMQVGAVLGQMGVIGGPAAPAETVPPGLVPGPGASDKRTGFQKLIDDHGKKLLVVGALGAVAWWLYRRKRDNKALAEISAKKEKAEDVKGELEATKAELADLKRAKARRKRR